MLCAIPFHLLYHFYNGLSFMAGTARHYYMAATMPNRLHKAKSTTGNATPVNPAP